MKKKYKNLKKYGFLLLIMVILLVLFPMSIKFMNNALLNNAQRMGEEIARRFAINEETYLNQYETVLRTVEYQIQNSPENMDLTDMMKSYQGYAEKTMDLNNIELYGYIDGKIVAFDIYLNHDPYYFDFILMDMQMPVMDGCQAAERIRKSGRADAEQIPIIAVTANAFAEDIALTKKAGMNAHISKPIDFRILKKTMADLKKGKN